MITTVAAVVLAPLAIASSGEVAPRRVAQQADVHWHAQSGNTGSWAMTAGQRLGVARPRSRSLSRVEERAGVAARLVGCRFGGCGGAVAP